MLELRWKGWKDEKVELIEEDDCNRLIAFYVAPFGHAGGIFLDRLDCCLPKKIVICNIGSIISNSISTVEKLVFGGGLFEEV